MTKETLDKWLELASAANPLIGMGVLAASAVVDLFKKGHPDASEQDANAILQMTMAHSASEQDAIRAELAKLNT